MWVSARQVLGFVVPTQPLTSWRGYSVLCAALGSCSLNAARDALTRMVLCTVALSHGVCMYICCAAALCVQDCTIEHTFFAKQLVFLHHDVKIPLDTHLTRHANPSAVCRAPYVLGVRQQEVYYRGLLVFQGLNAAHSMWALPTTLGLCRVCMRGGTCPLCPAWWQRRRLVITCRAWVCVCVCAVRVQEERETLREQLCAVPAEADPNDIAINVARVRRLRVSASCMDARSHCSSRLAWPCPCKSAS